jgi:hypothetical protein
MAYACENFCRKLSADAIKKLFAIGALMFLIWKAELERGEITPPAKDLVSCKFLLP